MRKLNVTDRRTDRRTDGQTDGRTDGGRCNISRPGPSAPREIKRTDRRTDGWTDNISRPGPSAPREIISFSYMENNNIFGYLEAWGGGGGTSAMIKTF